MRGPMLPNAILKGHVATSRPSTRVRGYFGWNAERIGATLGGIERSVRMADNDPRAEADEARADDDDELEEADEESFPASDPPATWSGPEE